MKKIHIITPVKDSIELTIKTIEAVVSANYSTLYTYTIYNDFSTPETTQRLTEITEKHHIGLINLEDITQHPSPNYLLVLQMAQKKALEEDAALCIVESDVVVKPDTLQRLFNEALSRPDCGIAAAVTVDQDGAINYPYIFAKGKENRAFSTNKHLSFCCSLITTTFMNKFSFEELDPSKNWHDVTISHKSLNHGFKNYLFTNLPVLHQPHGSRSWKQLKYTNPVKYYFLKIIHRRDKI